MRRITPLTSTLSPRLKPAHPEKRRREKITRPETKDQGAGLGRLEGFPVLFHHDQYSLFTIHYSLSTIHYPLFTIHKIHTRSRRECDAERNARRCNLIPERPLLQLPSSSQPWRCEIATACPQNPAQRQRQRQQRKSPPADKSRRQKARMRSYENGLLPSAAPAFIQILSPLSSLLEPCDTPMRQIVDMERIKEKREKAEAICDGCIGINA